MSASPGWSNRSETEITLRFERSPMLIAAGLAIHAAAAVLVCTRLGALPAMGALCLLGWALWRFFGLVGQGPRARSWSAVQLHGDGTWTLTRRTGVATQADLAHAAVFAPGFVWLEFRSVAHGRIFAIATRDNVAEDALRRLRAWLRVRGES